MGLLLWFFDYSTAVVVCEMNIYEKNLMSALLSSLIACRKISPLDIEIEICQREFLIPSLISVDGKVCWLS
jgi:hypothetical protein